MYLSLCIYIICHVFYEKKKKQTIEQRKNQFESGKVIGNIAIVMYYKCDRQGKRLCSLRSKS